jgi:hypothetical protein
MKAGYVVPIGANVALVAATAKTVLCAIAPAQFGIDWIGYEISFDGVTASAKPVLVELCTCTLATNSTPGTGNTTATVTQRYGPSITAGFTGFYGSTSEPTVITMFDSFTLTPNGGTLIRDFPKDRTPDTAVSTGFLIRCTAPDSTPNVRGSMLIERT